ncbi:GNAT family N-acetyltransferase [Glutamicibacter sp. NPDC087673]|uniref:GNAT family N-acetyltransferase n=1 Tax=Glutamicibacter sp. NPDC087673 TaxID=3363997 RepID=UPI00380F1642
MDRQPSKLPVTVLSIEHSACLQRLMESNPGYSQCVTGAGPASDAAIQALSALPPKAQSEQKIDLGLWEGEELAGFADLIVGWPRPDTVHIGLLMVDGARHGRGLGKQIHEAVLDVIQDHPLITACRISIVDANAAEVEPFWKSLGYAPTGEISTYAVGDKQSWARTWSRPITSMRKENLDE